jgi:hypothetical protein
MWQKSLSVKEKIWQRWLANAAKSGGQVKQFVCSKIWPCQTDPLKGHVFSKKGVK